MAAIVQKITSASTIPDARKRLLVLLEGLRANCAGGVLDYQALELIRELRQDISDGAADRQMLVSDLNHVIDQYILDYGRGAGKISL